MEEKIAALVLPITRELGLDLLRVRSGRVVQVIVDRKGGVDADLLAAVSRGLSLQLDVEDLIHGEYRLEVASPGLDWKLTTAADFERYQGAQISVRFKDFGELEGENVGITADGFVLKDHQGELHQIGFDEPERVIRTVNFKKSKDPRPKRKNKS
ncbi:MAG: ribosome assembly cofactor RimP [Zetaproteobacteria bacterium]|nr:ribosome assembly cofactor RimP [Zetaproteobacteria bacterium]